MFLKRQAMKLVVGLALIATLMAGVALGGGTTVGHAAPAIPHVAACGGTPYPPCW